MIDPRDVTKFDRTPAQLEEWWLFSCVVAGKTASTQARLLNDFLWGLKAEYGVWGERPFDWIEGAVADGVLLDHLRRSRLGQYRKLDRCFTESMERLELAQEPPLHELQRVYGVGPKTARMYILHSRPDQRLAVLDTHILKHLAQAGHTTPKVTPGSEALYTRLEGLFLDMADAAGKSYADYDLEVWKSYARD